MTNWVISSLEENTAGLEGDTTTGATGAATTGATTGTTGVAATGKGAAGITGAATTGVDTGATTGACTATGAGVSFAALVGLEDDKAAAISSKAVAIRDRSDSIIQRFLYFFRWLDSQSRFDKRSRQFAQYIRCTTEPMRLRYEGLSQ